MTPETRDRHFLPEGLHHRVINVVLIGCGGNGAQILMGLASLDTALRAISSRSLHVIVVDDDVVAERRPDSMALRRTCMDQIAEIRRHPVLRTLAYRGVAYDEAAKRTFHAEGRTAMRRLAEALARNDDDDVASDCRLDEQRRVSRPPHARDPAA